VAAPENAAVASTTPQASVDALPLGGGDKTGVSSQAINLPQGAGKIQGMGESFSTQLSTGVATFTVPFSLPKARGGVQPGLSLSYSSGSGHGLAGIGWDVGVASISRQTDRGLPGYMDPPTGGAWQPTQDSFVFNGGQELVPICLVGAGGSCTGEAPGESIPAWFAGWQYFRARVEGAFLRFFWSPDHRTWRVQSKTGTTTELGIPLNDASYVQGIEADPGNAAHIFSWNVVREYDAYGAANPSSAGTAPAPVNVVVYRYLQDNGTTYLQDIYDTPPVANAASAPLSAYAHHTRLLYASRSDPTTSYRRGWLTAQALLLVGVDVTSQPFGGGSRNLVRRYHLAYDPGYHLSILSSVQDEGRCVDGLGNEVPIAEDATGSLPSITGCPALPAMTFGYQHVSPFNVDGSAGIADLPGYEGFDERVTNMAQSPPNSIDENNADFFDIDADGLPDVVVTLPGQNGRFPFYRSGMGGRADAFASSTLGVVGVLGATSTDINLVNSNVAVGDLDGNGTVDWLHQPAVKSYAVYSPQQIGGSWYMVGRAVAAAAFQDPHLDLGEDTPDINVFDANGDGLADVVRTTGTMIQTFFSLGRFPGGDGNFGSATWTGPTSAALSLQYVASCVPLVAPGVPARFSDPSIRMGDMNGDGLQDIVYVKPGDVRYWPGRGDGSFGTGPLGSCLEGFAENTFVAMNDSPEFSDVSGGGIRIDDVNGDGLDDIVQLRFDAVDIWLNVDGSGWTQQRHTISGVTPASGPEWVTKVRLADVNGSGTRDVVWGEGGHYRYMDLSGGQRPWVLTHVQNGLGKTTDIQYASSTQLMLAAAAAGNQWSTTTPLPVHVVTQETESDHLDVVGRAPGVYSTQYSYRDPLYDGRQREFRGFRTTTVRKVGDANSPSSTTQSSFLLGECKNDEALAIDPCTPEGQWEDNPREALKGLPTLVETYDDNGVYQSTTHHTYRLRKLYAGLDGREVRHAFESQTDALLYNDSPFVPGTQAVSLNDVELETTLNTVTNDTTSSVAMRGDPSGPVRTNKQTLVDVFGNVLSSMDFGCIGGCPNGGAADEEIISETHPFLPPADVTLWMYRTARTDVAGSITPLRRDTSMTYDVGGNLLQKTMVLAGTLPLIRFHQDTTKQVAPPPPTASANGTIVVDTRVYDSLGQLVHEAGPNSRCRDIGYDPLFDELPTSETIDAGTVSNGCGQTLLTTTAVWDRALQVILSATDPRGATTKMAYDGLARLTSMTKPDPNALGNVSGAAALLIDYTLPADPTTTPYSLMHTRTHNGPDAGTASYHENWAYVDGLGRTIAALDQADPSRGDAGAWIVNGFVDYDAKGAQRRKYLPVFYSGLDPAQFPLGTRPSSLYESQRYDAFGRSLQLFGLDGSVTLQTQYHALSVDKWDAADLTPGPHQGTPASTTQDGHGRTTLVTERIHNGNAIEQRTIATQYIASGEAVVITRARVGASDPAVVRWLQYDSLGRMVLNVEPDTTQGYVAPPSPLGGFATPPGTLKAWQYAYNDNGDLVGTGDARGCGSNYLYDAGGRLQAEDFSPCLNTHALYSAPNLSTGDGTEAFYRYDAYDTDTQAVPGFGALTPAPGSTVRGRLAFVADRGAKTAMLYDGRGRVVATARHLPTPTPTDTLSSRYVTGKWYVRTSSYDGGDRPVAVSTGVDADVPALLSGGTSSGTSTVTTTYSAAGDVAAVSSSYGALVSSVTRDADRLVNQIVYGDVAGTTRALSHDGRRRLSTSQTYRGVPALWSAPPASYTPVPTPTGAPSTFQLLLDDSDYLYDEVDNPTEIRDWRNPAEWPAGAQPVMRKMQYDDLYRLTRVTYASPGGADPWTSPFDAEDRGINADPRRAMPSPHINFTNRVMTQVFQYDWLGNTTFTDDDAHGFYDRSLGTLTNGIASAGPYQLQSARASGTRGGSLTTAYDAAGSLTSLSVSRAGPCLPTGAVCSQTFAYDWDEVGRIVRARRWDTTTPGSAAPNADLRYVYDNGDARTLKVAIDAQNNTVYSAYIFGSLELRRTTWSGTDYARTSSTEVGYLEANGVRLARLHYAAPPATPTESGSSLHVLLELRDHLGSSSITVDHDTSELVERSTYTALGEPDGDYRPVRWDSFREDYRFTGKEEDVEVGLDYFGKRFYAPALGRWISADPLTVHALGADANAYAYVRGTLLRASDPMGLGDNNQPAEHFDASAPEDAPPTPAPAAPVAPRAQMVPAAGGSPNNGAAAAPSDSEPMRTGPLPGYTQFDPGRTGMGLMKGVWPNSPLGGLGAKMAEARPAIQMTPVAGPVMQMADGMLNHDPRDMGIGMLRLSIDAVTLGRAGLFTSPVRSTASALGWGAVRTVVTRAAIGGGSEAMTAFISGKDFETQWHWAVVGAIWGSLGVRGNTGALVGAGLKDIAEQYWEKGDFDPVATACAVATEKLGGFLLGEAHEGGWALKLHSEGQRNLLGAGIGAGGGWICDHLLTREAEIVRVGSEPKKE
jgi:RHS repeat-associated protein